MPWKIVAVTVLHLSDHPYVQAQRRLRLRRLAEEVLRLLTEGAADARIYRLLTPLPAGELAEVTAFLMDEG